MRISNFTRHEIYLLFQARVSRNRATKISPLRLKIKDQRSLCLSRVCLYRYRSKVKYHLDSPLRDFQKRGGLFESSCLFQILSFEMFYSRLESLHENFFVVYTIKDQRSLFLSLESAFIDIDED